MIKASKMVLEIKIDLVCKDRKSTFLAQKKLNFWVEASLQKLNTEMCTEINNNIILNNNKVPLSVVQINIELPIHSFTFLTIYKTPKSGHEILKCT
jgi:hypothetical protein